MIAVEQAGRGAELLGQAPMNPDDNIAERAESCLRGNSYLALKYVSCEYHDGVLTLRGCLPTYYLKQIAQAVVGRLDGVQHIVNDIEVTSAGRNVPSPA
jgi:osmotically-inducible protein OsmY